MANVLKGHQLQQNIIFVLKISSFKLDKIDERRKFLVGGNI